MRLVLGALAAAVVLTGCGAAKKTARIETPATTSNASRFAGGELDPPRKAPAIDLHDAAGRRFTLSGQRGAYTLVTFIYTHCPDVCPLIAKNLNLALRAIDARKSHVSVLAVSVDPKGDTPAAVRAYAKHMRLVPQFHYLIGSPAALRRTWTAWGVQSVQQRPDLVDHVAYTALIDPKGQERVLYDASVRFTQVVHDLRILMR